MIRAHSRVFRRILGGTETVHRTVQKNRGLAGLGDLENLFVGFRVYRLVVHGVAQVINDRVITIAECRLAEDLRNGVRVLSAADDVDLDVGHFGKLFGNERSLFGVIVITPPVTSNTFNGLTAAVDPRR